MNDIECNFEVGSFVFLNDYCYGFIIQNNLTLNGETFLICNLYESKEQIRYSRITKKQILDSNYVNVDNLKPKLINLCHLNGNFNSFEIEVIKRMEVEEIIFLFENNPSKLNGKFIKCFRN